MLTQEENERLTRVGPGTPMGNLLRRYWHPVGCSQLVTSKPKRVKVLGEDLVLYRGASGKAALMQLRCAHRGVALDYGRVEGDAIRCPYHGWLYGNDGRCLAQPAERARKSNEDETKPVAYPTTVSLTSYPTQEVSGLIFAYMGPAPTPVLPLYDVLRKEGGSKAIRSFNMSANWLQAAENSFDVTHFQWLHGYTFPSFVGKQLQYKFERTEYGMDITVGPEGAEIKDMTPFLFPAHIRFLIPDGEGGAMEVLNLRVPTDDYGHENYFVAFRPGHPSADGDQTVPAVRFDTKPGEYMPLAGDWWGIDLSDQDRMALEQQGAILDRTKEHLVASDAGIVQFRRMLQEALKAVERGEDPIGVIRDAAKQNVECNMARGSFVDQAQDGADYKSGLFSAQESAPA